MAREQEDQLKVAEAQLLESQRFLRSSLDALAGHVAVLEGDGTILAVNESWLRFARENQLAGTGGGVGANYFEPCERTGGAGDDGVPGGGGEAARGIREVIAGTREAFETEYPCHSPTQPRWFLMRATRFQGPGPVRVVVAHDNITERKRADAALRELAEHFGEHSRVFDRVLSSITDFAYKFDLDGRFTFANKPHLSLLGLTLEQVVGKTFSDLRYPAALATKLEWQIRQVIETRQTLKDETPFVSSTGARGYYQYIFSAVLGADGRVEAVAGSTRDVTEQKRVEEELRLSIVDRERLLSGERDARGRRGGRPGEESISGGPEPRASHAAHADFMTVAALELNADLPPTVRDDLKMIRRNVELESKLIDDLLDLSRITSGKLLSQLESLDINGLVRHVCEMCRPNLQEKGIRLECDLDETVREVVGDPARLHQVFWNLANNATKFTPPGGQSRIKTENCLDGKVRVSVSDTGIGIPPEILPRIFDAFEQGDVNITRQFGGLGLGLAISKTLVDQH